MTLREVYSTKITIKIFQYLQSPNMQERPAKAISN